MGEPEQELSNRERLRREVEELSDEQVAEVLEYVAIMRTMREQEDDPVKFKDEILMLLDEPPKDSGKTGDAPQPQGSPRQPNPKKPS